MIFVREIHPDADETLLFLHGGNVAGWSWYDLAASLPDHHSVIPDLPGFGASTAEPWTTVAEVADAAAAVIRERAHDGRAHVVGLSLGAVVGTVLVARHPEVVRSAMLSGAALKGVGALTRVAGLAQLRLWGSRSYWRVMARAFRLPDDSVAAFVETGLRIDRASARRMLTQVTKGSRPRTWSVCGGRSCQSGAQDAPRVERRGPGAVPSRAPALAGDPRAGTRAGGPTKASRSRCRPATRPARS